MTMKKVYLKGLVGGGREVDIVNVVRQGRTIGCDGVAFAPTGTVTGPIKLYEDPNTALVGVLNNVGHVGVSVNKEGLPSAVG
jgi:hypothetical protein